jgi:signal transduction histidine kinase
MKRADIALAAGVGALSAVEQLLGGPWPIAPGAAAALTVMLVAPLALWRSAPLVGFAGVGAGLIVWTAAAGNDGPQTLILVAMLGALGAGRNSDRRHAFAALGLIAGLAVALSLLTDQPFVENVLFSLVILVTPWLGGRLTRRHSDRARRLRELAAALDEERERHEQLVVLAERERIAAELNDAVAHALAEMLLQTGAASEVLESDRPAALRSMRLVQERGREAIADLRRMITVLRAPG